jgi:hypothetical protein
MGVLWLCLWCSASDLEAQGGGPIVQPRRDLGIGIVLAGVPKSISRLDPANSGMYRVQGRRNSEITLTFTLPSQLVSASGQTLPIEFAAGDAGFSQDQDQGTSVPFDPHVPFTVRLSPDGAAWVWLGGTARPDPSQAAGYYEEAVVLTAAYTGN